MVLLLTLACAGAPPGTDTGADPKPGDTGDTPVDTDTGSPVDTDTASADTDTGDTAETDTDTGETGDTGAPVWEPLAPYSFTSTWTNSACPSFAPYDVPGQDWRYRSIPGNPIAYALSTRGEVSLDHKSVWHVVLSVTGYDLGGSANWFLVCDSEGVKVAAVGTHQSGGGGPSNASATYYDPPLLLLPATLAEGSFSATTWRYQASDGNEADELPYTVTEGHHTQEGTVSAPLSYTTEDAGTFEVWPVTATTPPFLSYPELYVAEGYGVVAWPELFELDSYTAE